MATTSGSLEALRESKRRIPAVIRRLMRLYDVTGTDLGQALGVGRAAFYSRLQGTTVIKAEEVAALATYLRLPVEVFFLEPAEAVRVAAALGDDAGPPDVPGGLPEQGSKWIDRSLADCAWSAAPALLAG